MISETGAPGLPAGGAAATEGPLADVRVLDLTTLVAGPFCTKLLADHGADVIKVEAPGVGDPARRLGPFKDDDPHPEKSGLFFYLSTNKRSITLDLDTESGREVFRRLAATADLVVESFLPGTMARLGLDYETLAAGRPGLVMLSISNFGQTGPYREFSGSELTLYAMGAEMHSIGLAERPPLKQAGSSGLIQAGAMAAVAAMAGLSSARLQGVGQWVDCSIFEAHLASVDRRVSALLAYQFCGRMATRQPESGEGFPSGIYPCADGYVEIYGPMALWPRVVALLGNPPQLLDPKWTRPGAQTDPSLRDEFHELFYTWLYNKTRAEVWEAATAVKLPCAPLYTMEDLFRDPVFRGRGVWTEIQHPLMGVVEFPGRPAVWSETPWCVRRRPPLLGEHTVEVLGEAGYTPSEVMALKEAGVI